MYSLYLHNSKKVYGSLQQCTPNLHPLLYKENILLLVILHDGNQIHVLDFHNSSLNAHKLPKNCPLTLFLTFQKNECNRH